MLAGAVARVVARALGLAVVLGLVLFDGGVLGFGRGALGGLGLAGVAAASGIARAVGAAPFVILAAASTPAAVTVVVAGARAIAGGVGLGVTACLARFALLLTIALLASLTAPAVLASVIASAATVIVATAAAAALLTPLAVATLLRARLARLARGLLRRLLARLRLVAAEQFAEALDQPREYAVIGRCRCCRLLGCGGGGLGRGGRDVILLQGGRRRGVVDHALDRRFGTLDRLAVAEVRLLADLGIGGQLEARLVGVLVADMVVAQALHVVVRGVHIGAWQQHHLDALAALDLGQHATLLVEQVGGHRHRQDGADLGAALLHGLLFDQAHDRQRHRAYVANRALAVAARADHAAGLAQRGTQALARHLHQAEARDAADLHPGAVELEGVAHAVLDLALVARRAHVDEVDHHQTTDIAQAQLAGNLVGGLGVGLQRGLFDVAAAGGAGRVDVDGDQRLGVIDDDRAAGGQLHFTLVGGLDLRLDLEAREQRHLVGVELDLLLVGGHHLTDEGQCLLVHLGAIDQHLADILAQVVAHGANDDVGLAVDQEGRRALAGLFGDRLPHLYQVVEVPLQFFGGAADAGGAHDHAHLVGQGQLTHGVLELGALVPLDAPRDAAGTGIVGHQHQEAPGQADEGGQGSALVAALLLVDLDDDFLAFLENFLDAGAPRGFLQEVLAGNFLEGEEAVTIGAEVDEGGFERGFYTGDLAAVDVGFLLLPGTGFDVQVVQALSIDQRNTQLFRLGRIDEHPFHVVSQSGRAGGHRRRRTSGCCVLVLSACRGCTVAPDRTGTGRAQHDMIMLSTRRRQDMSRRGYSHPALRSPPDTWHSSIRQRRPPARC